VCERERERERERVSFKNVQSKCASRASIKVHDGRRYEGWIKGGGWVPPLFVQDASEQQYLGPDSMGAWKFNTTHQFGSLQQQPHRKHPKHTSELEKPHLLVSNTHVSHPKKRKKVLFSLSFADQQLVRNFLSLFF
jgi:hypothetical protein